MSIKENIEEMINILSAEREQIGDDTKPHPIADKVRTRATKAILGGVGDRAVYMTMFAKSTEELERLIPTDGTDNDEAKNVARAYLIANGMCAPGTGKMLLNNVTIQLNL